MINRKINYLNLVKSSRYYAFQNSITSTNHYFTPGTFRSISGLRRVTPFTSLIKLKFDHIVGKVGQKVINTYILANSSIYGPSTNKNDLPINAARLLISYPLLWVILSTDMVHKLNSYNIDVCLPIYTWGLLDKYFIRVERENFDKEPGLHGSINSYINECSFKEFCESLFTDEFIFGCLTGTEFERLVTAHVDSNSRKYIYSVDNDFRAALASRLKRFDSSVYSEDFMLEVSAFYSSFSSKFRHKVLTVTKSPARRFNYEAGLHVVRNHKLDDCYIYHRSVDGKFDNMFFFNSFVVLSKLFRMEYHSVKYDDNNMPIITPYGNFEPGNNEIYIDLSSIQDFDVFVTLLSAGIRTNRDNAGNSEPTTPQNSLALNFTGLRQFSSVANPSDRSLDVRRTVPIGSIYYRSPVISYGYSRVTLPDGNVILVNII
jgi:hypothetical protein